MARRSVARKGVGGLPGGGDPYHIRSMAKSPEKPARAARGKDNRKPKLSTGKASKPELKPLDTYLADLLSPAVNRERAEAAGFAERAQEATPTATSPMSTRRWRRASACGAPTTGRTRADGRTPLAADGVSATVEALTQAAHRRQPALQGRQALGAAPPAAAGEVRRRHPLHASSPTSSRPATSRRRSPSSSTASAGRSATRCCSASPARARPSRWRR